MVKHPIMKRRKIKRVERQSVVKFETEAKLVRSLMQAQEIGAPEAARIILARHHNPGSLNAGFLQAVANGKIRIR